MKTSLTHYVPLRQNVVRDKVPIVCLSKNAKGSSREISSVSGETQ